jgi:polygalacturonase
MLISKKFFPAMFTAALASATGVASPRAFDVTQVGAARDGKSVATAAVTKAIDAAAAAGGGTVYFPAGTYLSGSIHLKSNVALYLDAGSTLLASPEASDYDRAEPNQWENSRTTATATSIMR